MRLNCWNLEPKLPASLCLTREKQKSCETEISVFLKGKRGAVAERKKKPAPCERSGLAKRNRSYVLVMAAVRSAATATTAVEAAPASSSTMKAAAATTATVKAASAATARGAGSGIAARRGVATRRRITTRGRIIARGRIGRARRVGTGRGISPVRWGIVIARRGVVTVGRTVIARWTAVVGRCRIRTVAAIVRSRRTIHGVVASLNRRGLPLPPFCAHGGRSPKVERADCEVAGRLLLPNPCGARPESVALPWAFQVRLDGREALLFSEAGGRELFVLAAPRLREPCCE